jgi:hypothetical protein
MKSNPSRYGRGLLPTLLCKTHPQLFESSRHARQPHGTARLRGGCDGSSRWFEVGSSNVQSHYVVRGDGGAATQMVDLADHAWHACTFNRRSIGIEVGGFASRGFDALLLATTARICAYLCHHLQILLRHARAGVGPGIASHHDFGAAGGGHHDPRTILSSGSGLLGWSMTNIVRAISPTLVPQKPQKPCLLSPVGSTSSVLTTVPTKPDVRTITGLADGIAGAQTEAKLPIELGNQTRSDRHGAQPLWQRPK